MARPRTPEEIQNDQQRIAESVGDAVAVANTMREPDRSLSLPAMISAVITAKSLGGLLKRLFGVSNTDMPYIVATDTYPIAVTTAAIGAQSRSTLAITQDADFYAQRMSIVMDDDGAGSKKAKVQIIRLSNSMRIFSPDNGCHVIPFQGCGLSPNPPYVFSQPLFFPRNTLAQIIITAIAATAVGPTYFHFEGKKSVDVAALQLTTRRW